MLLRARIVLPIRRGPIHDGAVLVRGRRIVAAGRWVDLRRTTRGRPHDLGEVVLLPGLINAHCHLDYTDMAGQLSPPRQFTDWIAGIVALKAQWTLEDYARSWRRGAEMLLRTGTTTVADIEAVPELLPAAWGDTPLRVHSLIEMINVKSRTPGRVMVAQAVKRLRAGRPARCQPGFSPHAPYTASADVFVAAARTARARRWLVASHVAESAAEYEMFKDRRGAMFDWLKNQRAMEDCGKGSPVAHLERLGALGPHFLAVHVNYLSSRDATVLARRRVSVVHCPRSHAFFAHRRFPRRELESAGVNLCLGTDSLASTRKERGLRPVLSLLAEMQTYGTANPGVAPADVLRLATINGARALGHAGKLGELSPGALADLIAVPFAGNRDDAEEAVVFHQGEVASALIAGRWALPPTP